MTVTFTGFVYGANEDRCAVTPEGEANTVFGIPTNAATVIAPTLPTTVGSAIRMYRWGKLELDPKVEAWTALLTVSGWRVSRVSDQVYSPEEFDRWATEWVLIHDNGAKE